MLEDLINREITNEKRELYKILSESNDKIG